ncbi:uncharacterized protein LOC135585707 isoform X2 [Musa acuminata AAA Group]|uniref:uncharacterized protein LOC135585707 isoform X2 n=1 Tax=Musa acuminata AAA Group TaxID=214697 RepID=UPI0031D45F22
MMHEGAMGVASSADAAARRSKWAAMAASTWIQCASGGSYCFGVYSPMLKSSQGYDQSTLDSVAFFKDVGANIGVLSGLLISSRAGHGRTWVVHLVGAAQCFVGYLLMWLSVTGCVPRPAPALMCLYMLLAAHAQTFFNTANVVTAVENFPDSRGTVIGIMKMIEAKALGESSCHERTRLMEDNLEGAPEERTYDRVAADRTCVQHDPTASNKLACGSGHEPSNGDLILLQRGENFSITQAMSTCDFWLLFSAMACGMGSGLATVNNISQIGGSLGYTSLETSTLVSLWSIWNFLGRFGSGYISDYFLRRKGWARPLFISLTLAVMSVGHAVIATGLPGSLYVGSVLVGICYGSQWSLMPSITSELFGLQHFGTIFNTIAIASPFGSYILSVRVVGYIYDMESSTSSSDIHDCIGRHCFMLSFLIMASVSLFGTVVALILFGRTRRFYEQVIYTKLQSHVQ